MLAVLSGLDVELLTLAITGGKLGAKRRVWRPCVWHCYALLMRYGHGSVRLILRLIFDSAIAVPTGDASNL